MHSLITLAQEAAPSISADQLQAFAQSLLAAVTSGKWDTLAASGLVLAMWAVRKFGSKKLPWLATNEGLLATTAVGAMLGAIANTMAGGGHINGALLLTAAGVGLKALGGWKALVYMVTPLLNKLGLTGVVAALSAAPTPIDGDAIKASAAAAGAQASADAKPTSPMDLVNK